MRADEQTGMHLLLAVIVSVFSGILSLITLILSWEVWTVLLITVSCVSVWVLHIARFGTDAFYENLCEIGRASCRERVCQYV